MPELDTPAMRDGLTGLPSRSMALGTLDAWQGTSEGEVEPIHVMLLGLGRFDTVNLAYGEAAGDGALVEVARRMTHFAEDEFAEGSWFAARIGGGKFLLAAKEACSRERWQWLAEALADAVAHPIADSGRAGRVRLWPRIALMRALPGEGPELVVQQLATALDNIEREKGGRINWIDRTVSVDGRHSADLEADLLTALDGGEIELVYQPQYSVEGDRLIGAEALARWQHPQLGQIGAGTLFALAERTDHVAQLSRHIVQHALAEAAKWPAPYRLSVNVTPADLAAAGFAVEFLNLLGESEFPPKRLTVEITEQVLLANIETARASLQQLVDAGVSIALDDFGAGFCNFRYLKLLPLHILKLDRAMVDGIVDSETDRAVLRGIVAMAKALGLKVTVEGIESEDQLAIIVGEDCDHYQGFLKAAPMDGEAIAALLNS